VARSGRGYFVMARFYSPKAAFFDKSWHLGEIIKH
jgi:hypothetical protein